MDVDRLYEHMFAQDSELMKKVFDERQHQSKAVFSSSSELMLSICRCVLIYVQFNCTASLKTWK